MFNWAFGFTSTRRFLGNADIEPSVDKELLCAQVEDLIKLSLLYHISQPTDAAMLPRVRPEAVNHVAKKKEKARAKRFTLFKVVRLDSPPDRFGRSDSERETGGWTLGQRIQVRGHFRWQAHGPQHGLRRLQWIKAYQKGPVDGEQKLPLVRPAAKALPEAVSPKAGQSPARSDMPAIGEISV